MRKLTLAFTAVLLVPILLAAGYTYQRIYISMRDELIQSHRQTLVQVRENIEGREALLHNAAVSIAYNVRMHNFLLLEFTLMPFTLEQYKQQILPIVHYALNYNYPELRNIRIYMKNTTIPELWETFFWEWRVKALPWHRSLYTKEQEYLWVYPNPAGHFERRIPGDETPMVTLVQRIRTTGGRPLGVVALDTHEQEFFSAIDRANQQGAQIMLVEEDGHIRYGADAGSILALDNGRSGGLNGTAHIQIGDELYIITGPVWDGNYLVSQVSMGAVMEESRRVGRYILAIFFMGGLLLIYLMHLVLRSVFVKLNQVLSVMDTVAEGDFTIRVPVDRRDELGKLAIDFNILIERINALIDEMLSRERAQKDAQLIALQYQINPHFIYNTIDSFRMKLELSGNYDAAEALTDFGKMLRYNMSNNAVYASLQEELAHTESYIHLQKFRFGERLTYEIQADASILKEKVIKFILQPVVENSIKHGLTERHQHLHIYISIIAVNDRLWITVKDNGKGISVSRLEELNYRLKHMEAGDIMEAEGENIGLFNIRRRLKLFYGDAVDFQILSSKDVYTETVIRIPRLTKGDERNVPDTGGR